MAKNKRDYWTERQKKLNEQQDKDEKALSKRLEKYYDKESRKLEKEIARYYEEYGKDNVIEYRRLLEQLPEEDVRLLYEKMDDFAVKYPEYAHLMPVRESIYKLNRLEGLKTSVDMQMLENGAYLNKEVEKHLNKTALRNMMDASKILGNSFNFEDENVIRTFVGKAWTGGTNFSEKIWGNTKKLAEYINKDLAQGFARGTNYEKMVKRIRERYTNVSRKDAMRLVYTEGTYVMNESRARVFENDFEEYEIIPIEDKHTCDVCRGLQGMHFPYKDREPGENYPPLHPWCRCVAAPYTPEWDEEAFVHNNKNNMNYRHKLDDKDVLDYDDDKHEVVIAKKLIGSPNNIYVSDNLNIKPKQIQEMEKLINESKKHLTFKDGDAPKIVLINDSELGANYGRYDAKTNTIFYKILVDQEKQKHMVLHELYHWEDAQQYISKGNVINSNNDVINYEKAKAKVKLDKLGINVDNISTLNGLVTEDEAVYAFRKYREGRFDEVYTEYRTFKKLKRK